MPKELNEKTFELGQVLPSDQEGMFHKDVFPSSRIGQLLRSGEIGTYASSIMYYLQQKNAGAKVYVGLKVDGVSYSEAQELENPRDTRTLVSSLISLLERGILPKELRVYLVAPSEDVLRSIARKTLEKAISQGRTNFDPKKAWHLTTVPKRIVAMNVGEVKIEKKIFGENRQFDIDFMSEYSPSAAKADALNIVDLNYRRFSQRQLDPYYLGVNTNYASIDINKMIDEFAKFYYSRAIAAMDKMFARVTNLIKHSIFNNVGVLRKYAQAAGKEFVEKGHSKSDADDIEDPRVKARHAEQNPPGRHKSAKLVSPSMPGSYTGETSSVITANPQEKVHQRADGTYVAAKRSSRAGFTDFYPVKSDITPVLGTQGERYEVYIGLIYNSPLVPRDARSQPWWYANAALLSSAAEAYGKITGDIPDIATHIVDAQNPNDRRVVAITALAKGVNTDARNAMQHLKTIFRQVRSSASAGQANHESYLRDISPEMAQFWRSNVDRIKRLKGEDYISLPENISSTDWRKFLSKVRSDSKRELMIFFNPGKEDPAFSSYKSPKDTRREVQSRVLKKHMAGDEWSILFVEYILGYTQGKRNSTPYIVPVNVVENDVDPPPGKSFQSISEKWLKDKMSSLFKATIFSQPNRWKYIHGSIRQAIPYPRLVRPVTMTDLNQIEDLNRSFYAKTKSVIRTQRGFKIDGEEYEAHAMVIAMPSRKARKFRKEGGFGLLPQGKRVYRVSDDPEPVRRAVRVGNLSPFNQKVATIDPRSKEVRNEVLATYKEETGKGPYRGQTQYNEIRPGTFKIELAAVERGPTGRIEVKEITGKDNNSGTITGKGIARGRVNYKTGQWEITFSEDVDYALFKQVLPKKNPVIRASYYVGSDTGFGDYREKYLASPEDLGYGVGSKSELPPGYLNMVSQRYHTQVESLLSGEASKIRKILHDYETAEEYEKNEILQDYYSDYGPANHSRFKVENFLRRVTENTAKQIHPNFRAAKEATQFVMDYADKKTRTLPIMVRKHKLRSWTAPIHSVAGRTVNIHVVAPSEDVAKLVILYRLLRRSADNPKYGNLARVKSMYGKSKVFPDLNARLLAQWAKSNFIVLPDDDVKNVRTIAPVRKPASKFSYESRRSSPYGEHASAIMWRHR